MLCGGELMVDNLGKDLLDESLLKKPQLKEKEVLLEELQK